MSRSWPVDIQMSSAPVNRTSIGNEIVSGDVDATGTIAVVRAVMTASTVSAVMQKVAGSMSQKTGRAPAVTTASAVA